MIHLHLNRNQGHGDFPIVRDASLADAVGVLRSDFDFLGRVLQVTPTCLVTQTGVAFFGVDTHTYSGTTEEMLPLYDLAMLEMVRRKDNAEYERLLAVAGREPPLLSAHRQRLFGDDGKYVVMALALGLASHDDVLFLKAGDDKNTPRRRETLQALIELQQGSGMTLTETAALCGVS